jgi:hypothetical protein
MSLQVTCPNGHNFAVADKFAGKRGKCPHCQAPIEVPAIAVAEVVAAEPIPPPIASASTPPPYPKEPAPAGAALTQQQLTIIGIVAVGAGLLLFSCCCCGVASLGTGDGDGANSLSGNGNSMTGIENSVKGRSKAEVTRLLGKPNSVTRYPGKGSVPPREVWDYNKITTDPTTGKRIDAQIVFEGDRVDRVNWY